MTSMWELRILADESRHSFYLDLRSSDIANADVQRVHEAREIEMMIREDRESAYYRRFEDHSKQHLTLTAIIRKADRDFESTQMPKLRALWKKHEENVNVAKNAMKRLLGALDAWVLNRACLVTDEARKRERKAG